MEKSAFSRSKEERPSRRLYFKIISASLCVSFLFCLGQKHNYSSRKMLIAASQKCVKPKSPSNSDYKALSSVGTVGLCSRSNLCLKVIKIFDQPEPRAALNGKEGGKLAQSIPPLFKTISSAAQNCGNLQRIENFTI